MYRLALPRSLSPHGLRPEKIDERSERLARLRHHEFDDVLRRDPHYAAGERIVSGPRLVALPRPIVLAGARRISLL
jgi:hypothetical protein